MSACGATRMPASAATSFVRCLSMDTAAAVTPPPT